MSWFSAIYHIHAESRCVFCTCEFSVLLQCKPLLDTSPHDFYARLVHRNDIRSSSQAVILVRFVNWPSARNMAFVSPGVGELYVDGQHFAISSRSQNARVQATSYFALIGCNLTSLLGWIKVPHMRFAV
jgi:hypothetical protein